MKPARILADLNPPQREAVTTTEGPLLVLAGAGSGKTRVITRRVAYLIAQGIPPWKILAVTFTNKAAGEMKERVAALAGEASGAWVSTFHSFCARSLRSHAELIERTAQYAIYDADDRLRTLKKGTSLPPVGMKKPTVHGCLSKSIIRRIVRRHLNEVRYCYTRELQTKRDLYGRLVVKFSIASTGQVVSSSVQRSTLNNGNVEGCIATAVRRWLFPKPEACGLVVVSYPFVLRSPNAQ